VRRDLMSVVHHALDNTSIIVDAAVVLPIKKEGSLYPTGGELIQKTTLLRV
jgi:hypothetical protein